MAKNNGKQADPEHIDIPVQKQKIKPQLFFRADGSLSLFAHSLIVGVLSILAWMVFKGCLNNQFTDWDDAGYIVNNPIIRDVSAAGLRTIFLEPVMGNYHPLTILSYAIEYSYVELEPWLYHFDSIILHMLVTMLVYWFVNLISRKPVAAIVTALLFSIHPMHVESVAWAAGRKDLLCALFYLGACITYWYYIKATGSKKGVLYGCVILLFLCSLLSKPVSVTLPLVLLLIDVYEGRERKSVLLIEKIPHFVLALIFGIISVRIQHGGGAMDVQKVPFNFLERIALGSYALVSYLWKAVVPIDLCCLYPYPQKVNGSLPIVYYLNPLLIAALVYVTWKYLRGNKFIVFGSLFFIVNIALLLQFIPVGEAIVAERYSYIPYLGLFLIIGWLVSFCFGSGVRKPVMYTALAGVLFVGGLFGYLSSERCKAWYDASSLWTDELEKEPVRVPIAYNNLGYTYFTRRTAATDPAERKVYNDSAVYLMKKAVELKPDFVNAYQGLGMLYFMSGDFASSAYCFRTVLNLHPVAESYSDYGNLLLQTGKTDSALMEYNTAVKLNPELFLVRLNRGKMFKDQNRWEDALTDMDKAVILNPVSGEAYYVRSLCNAHFGNKPQALADADKAISLGYQVDNNYYQGLKN